MRITSPILATMALVLAPSETNMVFKISLYGLPDAIPILIYHRIDNSGIDYSTTTDLFEAEMEYLDDKGFTVLNMEDIGYDESTNHLYIKDTNH